MKQHLNIFGTLTIVLLFLAACGTAPPARPTPTDNSSETESDPVLAPESTVPTAPTPEPGLESYPPPLIEAPVQATREPGYPPPATFPPTIDPYPGGLVWIIRPVGVHDRQRGAREDAGFSDLRSDDDPDALSRGRPRDVEGANNSAHLRDADVHDPSVRVDEGIELLVPQKAFIQDDLCPARLPDGSEPLQVARRQGLLDRENLAGQRRDMANAGFRRVPQVVRV